MEVFSGDMSGKKFAIAEVMDKIRESQQNGHEYTVFKTDDLYQQPIGVMHMTASNIERFICNGNVLPLTCRARQRTSLDGLAVFLLDGMVIISLKINAMLSPWRKQTGFTHGY